MNDAINDLWTFRQRLLNFLAVATFVCTLGLLFVGASVTSYDVGMAVPDAPTSFEQGLFTADWLAWSFGAMLEHGHRILGAAVGLLAFLLALALFVADARGSIRFLGIVMVLTVIAQGLLGRYRVTLNALWGRELAAVHGCVAAICFGLMAALVVTTSKRWITRSPVVSEETGTVRAGSLAICALLFLQFVAGATLRHLGTGLTLHLVMAAAAVLLVLWQAAIVLLNVPLRNALGRPAITMLLLIVVQVFLGLGAYIANGAGQPGLGPAPTHGAALVASLHQVTGAMLLATSLSIAMGTFKHIRGTTVGERGSSAIETALEAAG